MKKKLRKSSEGYGGIVSADCLEPGRGGLVKTAEFIFSKWNPDKIEDTNNILKSLPTFKTPQDEFNKIRWKFLLDEVLSISKKRLSKMYESSPELLLPELEMSDIGRINSNIYKCAKDNRDTIENFNLIYQQMIDEGKCDLIELRENLHLLYQYFLKTQKPKTSFLFRNIKLKLKQIEILANETPFQRFIRAMNTITKLFKRSEWKIRRFDHNQRKKDIAKIKAKREAIKLAEYKGGITYLVARKPEVPRLRNKSKSSKTGRDNSNDMRSIAIRNRHFIQWTTKVKEEKEIQKSLQKLETASLNYGKDLYKLVREEMNFVQNFSVNRARTELLENVFKSYIQEKQEFSPDTTCCHQQLSRHSSLRKHLDPTEILQAISYKKVFENINREPGKRILEPSVFNNE